MDHHYVDKVEAFDLGRWSVSLASTVSGQVESLYLVHIVVVHAPLRKHVFAPSSELPIASIICAGGEHGVAILKVGCEDRSGGFGHHFQVAEEAVLYILAVLEVDSVRCVLPRAQPVPEAARNEHSICIDFHSPTFLLPLAELPNLQPHLIEDAPIHPGTRHLALDLVEFVKFVIDLDGNIVASHVHSHVAEHVPSLTTKQAGAVLALRLQQLKLCALLRRASVLRVHCEAIQSIWQLALYRHRMPTRNVAKKPVLARCAGLVAHANRLGLQEAGVAGRLAATSRQAIFLRTRAGCVARSYLDPL